MTAKEHREFCLHLFEADREIFDRAEERIQKYRKGNFTVKVVDGKNQPLKNLKIVFHQKSHDFKYGANLFMLDQFEDEKKNKALRDAFAKHFNLATVPFYWNTLEPEQGKLRFQKDSPNIYRRPAIDLCMDYCAENKILPKLRCLVYDKFIPDWLPKQDMTAMLELYEKRIRQIAERYRGKMYEYEVINETLEESWWTDESVISTRRDVIDRSFDWAKKYFPGERLLINDGNFIPEIAEQDYRHPYFLLLEMLISKGVPITKIGVQNHVYCGVFGEQDKELSGCAKYFYPKKIIKGLDILSELGKPLEITEVTIPTLGTGDGEEETQAMLLKYMYTLWFACPAMESVVYWNSVENTAYCDEGSDWCENNCRAGLFHNDLTPKKSGDMLYRLFHEVWHTDTEAVTDENGIAEFRGYYGDYSAEIADKSFMLGLHKGKEKSKTFIL